MGVVLKLFIACTFVFGYMQATTAYNYVKLNQLNTDHGLNQSNITGLLQDQDGYLWISTFQGINRYDGYRLSTIHSPDNILLNNYVQLIFEDSTGLIWIGAALQNNYVLNKQTNTLKPIKLTAPEDYKLEYPVISKIVEDKDKNLWLSTSFEIFFYNRKQDTIEYVISTKQLFNDPENDSVIRELLIVDKNMLIGTSNGLYSFGLQSHKINHLKHTSEEPKSEHTNNVKTLVYNSFNKIMVGTVEGLYEIDRTDLLIEDEQYLGKPIIKELNIWEIIEKDNFYWLATDQGLFKLFKNGELEFIFKYSDTPFNTSDDDINTMIEDREGNLWFGSRGDGVFKWHPNSAIKRHLWTQASPKNQLSDNTINAIVQSPDKFIWLATQNGLNRISPESGQVKSFMVNPNEKEIISDSTIYSIVHNNHHLWLNTQAGIKVVDTQTMSTVENVFPESSTGLFTKPVYDLYFFDKSNLAIINEDGIYNYNLDKQQITLIESTDTKGETGNELFSIFDTATGDRNSYFISGVDRLVKFSRTTGLVTDFHQLPPSENFRSGPGDVHRDNSRIWVTYPGYGIFILDANTGAELKFISEQSIDSNTVMDIFADDHQYLWMSSNEGLIRINKEDYTTRIFDSSDGFATSEFNGGTKLSLDNGDVFLGSVKGAFLFSPEAMNQSVRANIKNQITSVSLLSGKTSLLYSNYNDYHLELNHDDFGIKLEFSALLLDKPKQVKYRYWIEGDSAVEPTLIDKSELFLPTIETGENTLHISAIDYETGKETKPARIKITSHPAPWFSKTAFSLYIILIAIFISTTVLRYRKRILIKKLSHQRLKQSEERLSLALKGGNSGLWDWHANSNSVYEPRLLADSTVHDDDTIDFSKRLDAIHPEDRESVVSKWNNFLTREKSVFDVIYRMRDISNNWVWYRDMATVSQFDDAQKPMRVTGTFTNINERKEARDKMRLFSKAFENTRDIVFVLDQNKNVIAANQSFYKTTQYEPVTILGNGINFITDLENNRSITVEIFRLIHMQNHWEGEGMLIRHLKKPLPILISATSYYDNDNNQNFVFALTDIRKQKEAESELRKLANYDALTGLPNRALLLDRITHAIEHCRRRKQKLSLFFIDLDRFKQVNDTLGHDIGDLLLINVAHTIRRSIRHDDTVARLGGDEFVVMLEDIDGIDTINRIARNIIEQMEEPMYLRGHQISISPSIGIAIYPQDGDEPKGLIKHADIAMYHAKNAGRNNFQYYENSMNEAAKKRLNLENRVRQGLVKNEFFLVYQPQYDLASGKFCGMEALARWKDSSGKIVPPSEFIPIAEDLGLIIQMTETLLESAIKNLSRWHAQGIDIQLAFNLSARHLHHYDFNYFIDELLEKYTIKSQYLEFELTESVLMEDIEVARRMFGKLAEKGIELALDDFGTGYSSLQYLNQLPINKLKIDRSFVAKIGTSEQNDAIIKTIISLAKSLGLKTVAEGIETEQQLEFIRNAGTDQAQGYLLSKPLELNKIETKLFQQANIK